MNLAARYMSNAVNEVLTDEETYNKCAKTVRAPARSRAPLPPRCAPMLTPPRPCSRHRGHAHAATRAAPARPARAALQVDWDVLKPITVKGKDKPIPAYRPFQQLLPHEVEEHADAQGAERGSLAGGTLVGARAGEFVGRAVEVRMIVDALSDLIGGEARRRPTAERARAAPGAASRGGGAARRLSLIHI